mmetsp:Transcript_25937/g.36729  ORF Transcript_25937/g.36729 Transcript_25937/m.36729 type:complete len:272 (-) Transcript_25937:115-930(-)
MSVHKKTAVLDPIKSISGSPVCSDRKLLEPPVVEDRSSSSEAATHHARENKKRKRSVACLETSNLSSSRADWKMLVLPVIKALWSFQSETTICEVAMDITCHPIPFAQFLDLYHNLCNSAKNGILMVKKPVSSVISRFEQDDGCPVEISHMSGKGISGDLVLLREKTVCGHVGVLTRSDYQPMNKQQIEEFVASKGLPCSQVTIKNEWKFQYKQTFVYRLTQVAHGYTKTEACQQMPKYYVEVVILDKSRFLSDSDLAENFYAKCCDLVHI